MRLAITSFILFCSVQFAFAGNPVVFKGQNQIIGKKVQILEDKTGKLTLEQVIASPSFKDCEDETPNLNISGSTFWIRFSVKNETQSEHLLLELAYPIFDECICYSLSDSAITFQAIRDTDIFSDRKYKHQSFIFDLLIPSQGQKDYLLKVKGSELMILPLIVGSPQNVAEDALTKDILAGIHIGILLVMLFYNLFVFASTRDISYIYYVFYILFIGLTQTTITGYSYKYFWPTAPGLNDNVIILFPSLAGIFAILFIKSFLHTSEKAPLLDKVLTPIMLLYASAGVFRLAGNDMLSYRLIDISGLLGTIMTLTISIKLTLSGYRPARFFLTAWVIFMFGLILYILRNLNIVPYTIFTNYTMQAGTALEVTLLSFALADKINIFKKEKEESQAEALRIATENARIIREQNIVLEEKVTIRTAELTKTNTDLDLALNELKDAQSQLVDAEKMASLGQLTAGIAHEINNPINFVSSNIRPLKRDIADMLSVIAQYELLETLTEGDAAKQQLEAIKKVKDEIDFEYIKGEIDVLLKGMDEGASRTVEIVKSLKNFSRLDESDLKSANMNEGINSTLILLNNQLGDKVRVVKELGQVPNIDCYPGKLNQVFMNVLNNAIYAVRKNQNKSGIGEIKVKTSFENDYVVISITDNGVGMAPEIKSKIFEPFFTTKDVGDGTGLGLSIVYKIIESHKGVILVDSELGVGTSFTIKLPKLQK